MSREAYQNIDLTTEDIFGLLERVVCGSLRPSLDFVESRGKVRGRLGLGTDRVEVGRSCVLAPRQRDELVAGTFNHGKRDEVGRHLTNLKR